VLSLLHQTLEETCRSLCRYCAPARIPPLSALAACDLRSGSAAAAYCGSKQQVKEVKGGARVFHRPLQRSRLAAARRPTVADALLRRRVPAASTCKCFAISIDLRLSLSIYIYSIYLIYLLFYLSCSYLSIDYSVARSKPHEQARL
jgi:hypothetical protein